MSNMVAELKAEIKKMQEKMEKMEQDMQEKDEKMERIMKRTEKVERDLARIEEIKDEFGSKLEAKLIQMDTQADQNFGIHENKITAIITCAQAKFEE